MDREIERNITNRIVKLYEEIGISIKTSLVFAI